MSADQLQLLRSKRNVTLRQLRAFVAVARTGSFSLAAESLFVSQSAVSALIKELETALGLVLIDRSTRRLQLSEVGEDLLPIIGKVLNDLDHALDESANLKDLKSGLVRIAAPQLMSSTLLPGIIAAYTQRYPGIRVKLVDCAVESVVSRVFSGEVDIGLGPERDNNSDIHAQALFKGPFMAVFPPGHPLEKLRRVCWSDLTQYPLISLQGQFIERLSEDLYGAIRGMVLEPANEVTFMSTALAMVNAGLGVTICVAYATPLVKLYQLEMRALYRPVITRSFYLFTRQGRALSPAATSFIHFLHEYMGQHPMLKATGRGKAAKTYEQD
ncbi:LysR family transcriptional regulator [Paenalcaligenes sp. Me131]|uniref:LysR family transcriptional regulator n=1 Tax=Paenalcaligenes sp. Me131 TaxID=3392636 RepID=UPI003D2BFC6E